LFYENKWIQDCRKLHSRNPENFVIYFSKDQRLPIFDYDESVRCQNGVSQLLLKGLKQLAYYKVRVIKLHNVVSLTE
jgi:hypothetical protein